MSIYHDEIEIEDFEFDEEEEMYYYPCPCGDRFEISKVSAATVRIEITFFFSNSGENSVFNLQEELIAGEEVATCPSCSLIVRVIYDAVSSSMCNFIFETNDSFPEYALTTNQLFFSIRNSQDMFKAEDDDETELNEKLKDMSLEKH